MRISLDTQLCNPQAVGVRAGVADASLRAWSGRLAELQPRLDAATRAGLLPHATMAADPQLLARCMARGAAWAPPGRGRSDRLVLVAEPGAAGAATVLAGCSGLRAPVVVDRPDRRLVEAVLTGARRPRLLVVDGASWVLQLAAEVQQQVKGGTVFFTQQDVESSSLPGASTLPFATAQRVSARGSGDARFGVLGAAGLAVAGWSGLDPAGISSALQAIASSSATLSLRRNPAGRLALMAHELCRGHGLVRPVLLSASPVLAAWSSWASRTWAAFSSRPARASGGYVARGCAPLCVQAGDESYVQRLIAGPRNLWVLVIEIDAEDQDPLGALARQILAAHVRQLVRDGRPVLRLRLVDSSAATLAQLSWLWTHAALVAAAMDPVDPLTLDAADDWRVLLTEGQTG